MNVHNELKGYLILVFPSQHWLDLEPQMMEQETTMPVYFAYEDEELLAIHKEVKRAGSSDQAETAAEGEGSSIFVSSFTLTMLNATELDKY